MRSSLSFLYKDEKIFALNKPALLHSVLHSRGSSRALANLLLAEFPTLESVAPNPGDAGLVQRLDFETSGVIFGAWDSASWESVRNDFKSSVGKQYLIVVDGKFPDRCSIEGYIGGASRGAKKVQFFEQVAHRTTKVSTDFKLVRYSEESNRSLVSAQTATGARHQVRVLAAKLGYPLSGDVLYRGKHIHDDVTLRPFFLHAAEVVVKLSHLERALCVTAPIPEEELAHFL